MRAVHPTPQGGEPPPRLGCTLDFEGRPIAATPGEPVAVALLRAGERILARSVKYHRPRGLQCMQEHCASCLLRIDGVPNRFGCTTPSADGMAISRQNAFPSASLDVGRTIDWAFPETFNHHQMLAGVPIAEKVMVHVARQLAGLGALPAAPGPAFEPAAQLAVDTLLVGLGRAGRASLGTLGAADLAVEALPFQGNDRAWSQARALGIFFEAGAPVVAIRRGQKLYRVLPRRLRLCVGSRSQLPPFPGNDLPGVLTDHAARALARHRVTFGPRAVVVGESARAQQAAAALRALGVEVFAAEGDAPDAPADRAHTLAKGTFVTAAKGGRHVERALLAQPDGTSLSLDTDAIVLAWERAPAFELAQQAGAALTHVDGRGFAIQTDGAGQTSVPWLFAHGSCAEAR